MKFLNNLPDVYSNATVEGKQRLLRLIVESATYDTESEALSIRLKPIFQALRITKSYIEYHSEKVTTLEKLIITKKEPLNEILSKNGATYGATIEPLYNFIQIAKSVEYQELTTILLPLVA